MQPSCTGVGVTNLLASSRAMRAGESENSENCVVKMWSFPMAPGAVQVSERPAIGSGQKRRANSSKSASLRIKFCVRENRRVELRLAHRSIGPGAATRYIIARRHIAERHHAPDCSRFRRLISFKDTKAFGSQTIDRSRAESPGWRLKWSRCRGLGENLCWGKLALIGLAAAHGQITERKYSIARKATKRGLYRLPDTAAVYGSAGIHSNPEISGNSRQADIPGTTLE